MEKIVYTNVPNTPINSEIMHSVIGQMSDGIWENSKRMEKVWFGLYVGKSDDGMLTIITEPASELHYKSDADVRSYFADKIKQIVKTEIADGRSNMTWSRNCTELTHYLNYYNDVQVRDAYKVYDILKSRNIKQTLSPKN